MPATREATGTLSSEALRVLALGAATRGVDLCQRFGIEPAVLADPALGAILESHARLLLARLPAADSFGDEARAAIHAAMLAGDVGLDAVAARLGLTARTLQRRLQDAGASLQQLVDEVRREAAQAWLAEPHVSIAEVAIGLAFAEVSAIHRAFVRWTS